MERNWEATYGRRRVSAAEAMDRLMPGDRIFVSTGCGAPLHLVEALAEAAGRTGDAEVVHFVNLGSARLLELLEGHYRINTFAIGGTVQEALARGGVDYTPLYLCEAAHLMRRGVMEVDVALVSVSPPDDHGFCSLGISVDLARAAVDTAPLVIAQVNPRMPRTLGDTFVHVADIDLFVEHEAELVALPEPPVSEEIVLVARNVARLIRDGDTLALGFGSVAAAIPQFLSGRRDLGAHTEWLSDGLMHLHRAGVLTGRRKELHPGQIVASMVMGSAELYEFVHENRAVHLAPSEYVNDPTVFSKNDRMVAVNQEQFVDLTGQTSAARTLGTDGAERVNHWGRHLEFGVGAAMSRGGRSIVCLPSTTGGDTPRSRVRLRLPPGACVSTSRADVHAVVTEHGVAELRGRTLHERALALIQIAHPDHRERLLAEAKEAGLVYTDQLPVTKDGSDWPQHIETTHRFGGGLRVAFRPVQATDVRELRALFYKLSDRSRRLRFFAPVRVLPRAKAQQMAHVDFAEDMVIVGRSLGHKPRLVAVGQYLKLPGRDAAEVSFLVHEEYQRRGIGTFCVQFLAEIAALNGIRTFVAELLPQNRGMVRAFERSGLAPKVSREPDLVSVTVELPAVEP